MRIVIIDGQGGRLGRLLTEAVVRAGWGQDLVVVGTNSIATSAMMKAGAPAGATGENPVLVACRSADVIMGPLGLLVADSLLGEITPAMAAAVGASRAVKLLLPVNMCRNRVVGVADMSFSEMAEAAVRELKKLAAEQGADAPQTTCNK